MYQRAAEGQATRHGRGWARLRKRAPRPGVLYRLSGGGLAGDSWLWGTMHVHDARMADVAWAVSRRLDLCAWFCAEISLDALTADAYRAWLHRSMADLAAALDEASWDTVERAAATLGLDVDHVRYLPPFLVHSLFVSAGERGDAPLPERLLWDLADGGGLACGGLETPEESFDAIGAIPALVQLDHLVQVARQILAEGPDAAIRRYDALFDVYTADDLQALLALAGPITGPLDALVGARDHRLAGRLLCRGVVAPGLAAVGLAHIPGMLAFLGDRCDVSPVIL